MKKFTCSGLIPPSIGQITTLVTFMLNNNKFTGPFPVVNATTYIHLASYSFNPNYWSGVLTWVSNNLTIAIQAGSSLPMIRFPFLSICCSSFILIVLVRDPTACTSHSANSVTNLVATTNSSNYATFPTISFPTTGSYYYMVTSPYGNSICAGPLVVTAGPPSSIFYTYCSIRSRFSES